MSKTFRVDDAELQIAVKQARRAAKRGKEICGVLISENGHLKLISVKNGTSRCGAFEITPNWCRIALRADAANSADIVGTYHSHPAWSAEPGAGDIVGTWDGAYMLIIDCCDAKVKLWQIRGGEALQACLVQRTQEPCNKLHG